MWWQTPENDFISVIEGGGRHIPDLIWFSKLNKKKNFKNVHEGEWTMSVAMLPSKADYSSERVIPGVVHNFGA